MRAPNTLQLCLGIVLLSPILLAPIAFADSPSVGFLPTATGLQVTVSKKSPDVQLAGVNFMFDSQTYNASWNYPINQSLSQHGFTCETAGEGWLSCTYNFQSTSSPLWLGSIPKNNAAVGSTIPFEISLQQINAQPACKLTTQKTIPQKVQVTVSWYTKLNTPASHGTKKFSGTVNPQCQIVQGVTCDPTKKKCKK